jgi:hypothetical protein
MFRSKMILVGAVVTVLSLVETGPAFATATTLLFDDGPSGTSLITSVDGTVVNTIGPVADTQGTTNSFGEFVAGSFSIPTTNISILDSGTSLVSDDLQFSTINFGNGSTLTISLFGSNDISPLSLPLSNPVTETGFLQTLFSTQDEQGNTLAVQFLSEGDAPVRATNFIPEPSTFALFGAALAAFGMMMRRRPASSRA